MGSAACTQKGHLDSGPPHLPHSCEDVRTDGKSTEVVESVGERKKQRTGRHQRKNWNTDPASPYIIFTISRSYQPGPDLKYLRKWDMTPLKKQVRLYPFSKVRVPGRLQEVLKETPNTMEVYQLYGYNKHQKCSWKCMVQHEQHIPSTQKHIPFVCLETGRTAGPVRSRDRVGGAKRGSTVQLCIL